MVTKKYYLFLEALLVAIFIFTFGILVGVFIENARITRTEQNFARLETDILDARILSSLISLANCELAVQENMNFADAVFWEAQLLEKYDLSNELTESIKIQHKKYDLLRAIIWMNSIEIKEKCNSDYHNIVYFYEYINPSLDKKAEQKVISNLLSDLKNEKGNDILLISIAGDIGSPSIELLKKEYNITELPVILIDENVHITEITNIEDVRKYVE